MNPIHGIPLGLVAFALITAIMVVAAIAFRRLWLDVDGQGGGPETDPDVAKKARRERVLEGSMVAAGTLAIVLAGTNPPAYVAVASIFLTGAVSLVVWISV